MERSVKIDYLNFTTRRSLPEMIALFSYLSTPLTADEKGMYGYSFRLSSPDGVMVLYSAGRDDIHVQMSGRACDSHIDKLIELLLPADHVTRLDIALDCIGSGYTCREIWGWLRRGSFTSVCGSIRQIEGILSRERTISRKSQELSQRYTRTRLNTGHTIYIGASSSDRMVRIYDKGAESETGADWLRFEVQLRRESANQFFLQGVKSGDFFNKALALLNRQITFYDKGQSAMISSQNATRCKMHPFWASLTESVAALVLKIPKPAKTVRNAIRYVKSCGATIKMLRNVMPDFPEFFDGVVEDAKLKKHHQAMQDDLAESMCMTAEDWGPSYHFDALASLLVGPGGCHAQ